MSDSKACEKLCDLASDLREAIQAGAVTRQSIHLGTGQKYVTLLRDLEKQARKEIAPTAGDK